MSSGVNKVILVGNLGKDPEVRFSKSGTAVCNFSVAVNERRKTGDEWKDVVEWVNVTTFGNTAENVGKYLAKGRQVYVEGRMQTRKWQDKDGADRWSTEVVAAKVVFLGGGNAEGGERPASGRAKADPESERFHDDDLPF